MSCASCNGDGCPNAALLERARAACLACTRGGRPAGHGGTVSIEAAGERIIEREAAYFDRTPRGQVTNLAPTVEDGAAELLRRWRDLDTIDALLALHLGNGGGCANFGQYLNRVGEAIDKLHPERPAMRATAWSRWRKIVQRIPLLEKVQSWRKGHGGAKPGQGKGVTKHYKDPAREAQRIENQRKAAAKVRRDNATEILARLDVPGPTGFRWLAAMVQDGETSLVAAARRLGIGPHRFQSVAARLRIMLPKRDQSRRVREAVKAADNADEAQAAAATGKEAGPCES